ncbi:MAG: lactonase family protein [Chitinophagales bacterium]
MSKDSDSQKNADSAVNESKENEPLIPLYIGTYTRKEGHVDGKAKGIYVYQMNTKTGELSYLNEIGGITNPSYLTIHPNRKYLYAVSETGDGESAAVHAYSIDANTKKLTEINQVAAEGYAPCYISVEQTGKYALVANYVTGNVTMLPIAANGGLEKATSIDYHKDNASKNIRPRTAHAHFIAPDLNNRYALSADLGVNKLYVYEMDLEQGKLVLKSAEGTETAAGPRHIDFHPTLPYVYSINELNGTIDIWNYDAEVGKLTLQNMVVTYPKDYSGSISSADIHVHPSGKFLYASNRGNLNDIAAFQIDSKTGGLTFLERTSTQGKTPRNFVISPDGRFLLVANQDSSTVVVFSIDERTGKLTATGEVEEVPSAVCLKF